MAALPPAFLFRFAVPCPWIKTMPRPGRGGLVDLPDSCRIDQRLALAEGPRFADVRLAWNEQGIGVRIEVRGKQQTPRGSAERPRESDGLQLWIDTRDTRNIHRASRFCHHFFFLPAGGGPELDEPVAGQLKIHRAAQDAPLAASGEILIHVRHFKGGYELHGFLSAAALSGYDPENHTRLGIYYLVKDAELGEQALGVGRDFPYWDDPSLWATLELLPGH
jgi:hypothetical protein